MSRTSDRGNELYRGLNPASEGVGPLLQRDYWAVIRGSRLRPPELMELVCRRFTDFPPAELAIFRHPRGGEAPLAPGDEMEIELPLAGTVGVRVVHRDRNSITVATLQGHPVAGRITFGAYPNDQGDVILHIRSRTRSGSAVHYLGYLAAGEPMQSTTWTDFIDRVAHTVGEGVVGVIHEETTELEEEEEDAWSPTFLARGD